MIGVLWALIPNSVKWIGLSVLVGLIGFGVWKWEHSGRLKAEAREGTAKQALQIGQEGYIELYKEREAIKDKANQQRRKLNELQKANDLDGLADTFNNPGGVRRPLQPNPKGGIKTPARYRAADGTPTEYQEAP